MKRSCLLFLVLPALWLILPSCDLENPTEADIKDQIQDQWQEQQEVIQEDLLPVDVITDQAQLEALRKAMKSDIAPEPATRDEQIVRSYCRGYTHAEDSILKYLNGATYQINNMLWAMQAAGCGEFDKSNALAQRLNELLQNPEHSQQIIDLATVSNVGASEDHLLRMMQSPMTESYEKAHIFLAISNNPQTVAPIRQMESILKDSYYDEIAPYTLQSAFENYLNCDRADLRHQAWEVATSYFSTLTVDYDADWPALFMAICSYRDPAAAPVIRKTLKDVDLTYETELLKTGLKALARVEGGDAFDLIEKHSNQLTSYEQLEIYYALSKKVGATDEAFTQDFIDRMRVAGIFLTFEEARKAMEIIRSLDPEADYEKYRHLFERLKNTSRGDMEPHWAMYDLTARDLLQSMQNHGLIEEVPAKTKIEALARKYGNHCSDRKMISRFVQHYLNAGTVISVDSDFPSNYAWLIKTYFVPLCDGELDGLKVSYSYDEQSMGTRYTVNMLLDQTGLKFETFDEERVFNLPLVVRALNKALEAKASKRRLLHIQREDGVYEYVFAEPQAFRSFADEFEIIIADR